MKPSRYPALTKDAHGKNLCRGCGGPITEKYRRTWCSSACHLKFEPALVKQAVRKRDGNKCVICGQEVHWLHTNTWNMNVAQLQAFRNDDLRAEYDHIIPHSEGGLFVLENIRLLCRGCHKKRTKEWHKERKAKKTQNQPVTQELPL